MTLAVPTRRNVLAFGVTGAALLILGTTAPRALAQSADRAGAFIRQVGDKLVAIVNGPGSLPEKKAQMTQIIDSSVDVENVARFCLGRFWNTASPEQRAAYTKLFHEVLVNNITSKLGDYRGVKITVNRSESREDSDLVKTVVERPNNPPTAVDWVVASGAAPKILDVVAEGTSLRLTQRQDYMSYLVHNGNSLDKLIDAMRQQAEQNG
jgi:phospholipid transport system substrate-binding protein